MAHQESDPIAAREDGQAPRTIPHRRGPRVTPTLVVALGAAVLVCLGGGVGLGVHLAGQPQEPGDGGQAAAPTDPQLAASTAASVPADSTTYQRAIELAQQYAGFAEYDAALSKLDELTGVRLSPVQLRQLQRMRRQIREAMIAHDCRRSLRIAEMRTDVKRFDEAQEALAQASARLQQARLMGHLSAQTHESLRAVVQEQRQRLADARRYHTAVAAAEEAGRDGNRRAEQGALERAVSAAADANVSAARQRAMRRRLADVRAEIALAEVMAKAGAAAPDEALRMLREFARRHPGHVEATRAIVEAGAQQRRQRLVQQGDGAFGAGRWSEAATQYRRAAAMGKDAALTEKIRRCDYESAMARAREARKDGRYPDALAAADTARAAWGAGADRARQWQEQTRLERQQRADLAQAESAAAAGDWAAAKTALDRITSSTPEVAALRGKVAVEQHMASARGEMLRGNYPAARTHLKAARDHAPAGGENRREIDALIARIESLLRPIPPVKVAVPAPAGPADGRLPPPDAPRALGTRSLYGDVYFPETLPAGYEGGYVGSSGYYGGYGGWYPYYPQVWGNPYGWYHARRDRGDHRRTTTGTTSSRASPHGRGSSSRSAVSGQIRFGSPGRSGFHGSIRINR